MSNQIRPALTADQWNPIPEIRWRVNNRNFWVRASDQDRQPGSYVLMLGAERDGWSATQVDDKQHAIAALALYGQPFGFTREDVRRLRNAPDLYGGLQNGRDDKAWYAFTASLAARIEALLPPGDVR